MSEIKYMNKIVYLLSLLLLSTTIIGCGNSSRSNKNGDEKQKQEKEDTSVTKNTVSEIYEKPQVPVLCYHRIENGRNDEYTVSPAAFGAQMQLLKDSGYNSINPDQLYDYLVYNKTLPEKPFMITFDDSRVEHSTIAAPEMEKRGFHGVFFIMTITYNKKNYMTTDQIADLAKKGHTIGLHSWDHTMSTKYLSDTVWKTQIVDPKKKLEGITGKNVEYFAYPYGITNHEASKKMNEYFKLSFILSTKRDSIEPLQTVRRMIVPSGWTPNGMLKAMHSTFGQKKQG